MKYDWWFDNGLVKMPDLCFIVDLVSLQNKLSIKVSLFLESLVGSVIKGQKLYDTMLSKNYSFLFIFKRFKLKYPAIITSEFVLSNDDMIGVNSARNYL